MEIAESKVSLSVDWDENAVHPQVTPHLSPPTVDNRGAGRHRRPSRRTAPASNTGVSKVREVTEEGEQLTYDVLCIGGGGAPQTLAQ